MMAELDDALNNKIKPLVEQAMHKYLGIKVLEIEDDITDKLKQPLFNFEIDIKIPFKEAKRRFKKAFLSRVLEVTLGNISDAAKITGLERESLHRLINELGIEVRPQKLPKEYFQEVEVQHVIEDTLEHYKSSLQQDKFKSLYSQAPKLSREIVRELPVDWSLDKAEKEFERRYLKKALEQNKTIIDAAKAIKLRPETLHRKLKSLGLKN